MSGAGISSNTVRSALARGELIVFIDRAADRGVMAGVARLMSAGQVNLMVQEARGLVCLAVDEAAAFRLGLEGASGRRTRRRFLATVEAAACDGTGISAEDRALTLRAAGEGANLVSPGHVTPSLARFPPPAGAELDEVALAWVRRVEPNGLAAWCDILDEGGAVAGAGACATLAVRLALSFIEHVRDPFADVVARNGAVCMP